ncbi:ATP-binding protein [soil metagenome]
MTNFQRHSAYARFERVIDADPGCVSRTREELGWWLQSQFDLDSVRLNDMVLAVYEALANSAEFAYLSAAVPGTITMQGAYDPARSSLTLSVADQGRWLEADHGGPLETNRARGRGLALMRVLADRANIDTSAYGTTVRLQFDNVRVAASLNHAQLSR